MNKLTLLLFLLPLSQLAIAQEPSNHTNITNLTKDYYLSCSGLGKRVNSLNDYEVSTYVKCVSYMDGLRDGVFIGQYAITQGKSKSICFPEGISTVDLDTAYIEYLEKHPQHLTEPTNVSAYLFFTEQYRCQ